MAKKTKEPRYIKPDHTLKSKVGHGGISPALLKKSQRLIEDNPVDFSPYAKELLDEISDRIKKYKRRPDIGGDKEYVQKVAEPIMGLKANGGMFKYPLISMIADIGLQFLDRAGEINEHSLEIIKAHNNSISLIINANLKGYAGEEGEKICQELSDACQRYYKKYNIKE